MLIALACAASLLVLLVDDVPFRVNLYFACSTTVSESFFYFSAKDLKFPPSLPSFHHHPANDHPLRRPCRQSIPNPSKLPPELDRLKCLDLDSCLEPNRVEPSVKTQPSDDTRTRTCTRNRPCLPPKRTSATPARRTGSSRAACCGKRPPFPRPSPAVFTLPSTSGAFAPSL